MELTDENVIPIFGEAWFYVSKQGQISEILEFYYKDPDEYYKKLLEHGFQEELEAEISNLWNNLDDIFENEENILNQKKVYPKVQHVEIGIRQDPIYPHITWIIYFEGKMFENDENIYESKTDLEKLDYDCKATWIFPKYVKFIDINSAMNYQIINNFILLFQAKKGEFIGGNEKFIFRF
ncbi:MAG: hypothetical protein EAX96_02495 [Candidatus Lokiarchaeota archaeon]|nr:hypothetical protein [Candidatus Lokiarchaeota archaeon]